MGLIALNVASKEDESTIQQRFLELLPGYREEGGILKGEGPSYSITTSYVPIEVDGLMVEPLSECRYIMESFQKLNEESGSTEWDGVNFREAIELLEQIQE